MTFTLSITNSRRIFHQLYPSSSPSLTSYEFPIKFNSLKNPPLRFISIVVIHDFLEFAWGQPGRGKEARVRAGIKRCASSRLTTAMNNSWTAFPHTARMLFWERGRTQESVDNDLSLALLPPSLSFSLSHTHSHSLPPVSTGLSYKDPRPRRTWYVHLPSIHVTHGIEHGGWLVTMRQCVR